MNGTLRQVKADIVVIACDVPRRHDLRLLGRALADRPMPVVMFVGRDGGEFAREAMAAGVSSFVVDGLQAKRVGSVLKVAQARFETNQALRAELAKARSSLAERKDVERAKGIIMRQRRCDEAAAYAMLRSTAMSQNQRIGTVARKVIAVSDMLSEPA